MIPHELHGRYPISSTVCRLHSALGNRLAGVPLPLYTFIVYYIAHTHQIVALPLFIGVGYQLLYNQWLKEAIKSSRTIGDFYFEQNVCVYAASFYYILITINITDITINSNRHKYPMLPRLPTRCIF